MKKKNIDVKGTAHTFQLQGYLRHPLSDKGVKGNRTLNYTNEKDPWKLRLSPFCTAINIIIILIFIIV